MITLDMWIEASKYPHPGKFEGELNMAPYFFNLSLDGEDEIYGDCEIFGWCVMALNGPFEVSPEHKIDFDLTENDIQIITQLVGVFVYINDQGFVSVLYAESPEEYEKLKQNYKRAENEQYNTQENQ